MFRAVFWRPLGHGAKDLRDAGRLYAGVFRALRRRGETAKRAAPAQRAGPAFVFHFRGFAFVDAMRAVLTLAATWRLGALHAGMPAMAVVVSLLFSAACGVWAGVLAEGRSWRLTDALGLLGLLAPQALAGSQT